MSSIHSKNYHAARLNSETAIASGSGTPAYDQQKLSSVVGMAHIRSWSDNMFPMQKIAKEALESQDDGVMGGEIVTTGWEGIDSSREEYLQDALYFDKIIALIALQGALPPTYALHWQDHIHNVATPANDNLRYEAFGVFVKELNLKIPVNTGKKDSFPYWTVKEACYSLKYDDAAGTTVDSLVKVPWLTLATAPIATLGSYTIGGNPVNGIEADLNIVCLFDESKDNGDEGVKLPYFQKFENITFTVTFRNYAQYKLFIVNTLKTVAAETLYTIKITSGLASVYPNVTNMRVAEGDLNRIPEKGQVKYTLTFEKTDDTVLTKETS